MKINRRGALGLAGAATLSATIGTAAGAAEVSAVSFRHGVASGDPRQDRVILWTRVTPAQADAGPVDVDWEIAEDPQFKGSVRRGTARTSAARDFTVKVDVTGLRPLTRYHYRFRCGGQTSPVGQTQTLPEGKVKDMVIAVASCALYSTGFFNAYKEMAKLERVDLMLHLGDYIYEYGGAPDQLGMSIGQKIGRAPTPLHEAVTLADYRERHSCYRLDPDLQAAHARAPWICVWDDHETANDCWTGGAQNHQPDEGDWVERRAASIRAYYEWIPIREPEQGRGFEEINRTFELGDLATLVMLENRHIGRSRQISLRDPQDAHWLVVDRTDPAKPVPVTDAAIVKDVLTAARTGKPIPAPYGIKLDTDALRKRIEDPSRSVLGDAQEKWLRAQLETSVRAGKPWQILGNQVVMARTTGVDVVAAMGKDGWEKALAQMTPYLRPWVRQLADLPRDIPFEFDGWNAYPAARARMDAILVESGARPLILSGDSHAFWMNELNGAGRRRIAAEIGTTAITSSSLGNMLGNVELGPAFADACEEVLFNQHLTKGFALLTLSAEEAKVDLIGVTTVLSRDYKRFTLKSYRILPGTDGGIKSIDEV
ncbi:alkaline phosphatase D family protein [Rhodocista pekingensis]|uniref:Alkaline phosphatase D family protein n=1 Tax=Rhodocista pekingensis TaxID=201185 RepID=A0ABW2KT78_9PROT